MIGYYSTLNFIITWFQGSFNLWLTTKVSGPELTARYTTFFGVSQSLGLLISPFTGMLIDRLREHHSHRLPTRLAALRAITIPFVVANLLVVAMLAVSLAPSAQVQYLTMALRIASIGVLYPSVAAFTNAGYPTAHFGVVYGVTESISTLTLLLQYPLTLLLTRVLGKDFAKVNGALLVLASLALLHPAHVIGHVRGRAEKIGGG